MNSNSFSTQTSTNIRFQGLNYKNNWCVKQLNLN